MLYTEFSPRIIQGTTGVRGLGMACGHIKAFCLLLFHIKEESVLKACRADMPKYAGENTGISVNSMSFSYM